MNELGELDQLYEELQDAKKRREAAWAMLSSCNINTPGKCANEAKSLKAAEAAVSRIEARIRKASRPRKGVRRHGGYDPQKLIELAYAVVEQGIEDAKLGDPSARRWLNGPGFKHWCDWLDIDIDAAREAVIRQCGKPRYNEADFDRCIALHDNGVPWESAIRQTFGYYSETLKLAVYRYYQAG